MKTFRISYARSNSFAQLVPSPFQRPHFHRHSPIIQAMTPCSERTGLCIVRHQSGRWPLFRGSQHSATEARKSAWNGRRKIGVLRKLAVHPVYRRRRLAPFQRKPLGHRCRLRAISRTDASSRAESGLCGLDMLRRRPRGNHRLCCRDDENWESCNMAPSCYDASPHIRNKTNPARVPGISWSDVTYGLRWQQPMGQTMSDTNSLLRNLGRTQIAVAWAVPTNWVAFLRKRHFHHRQFHLELPVLQMSQMAVHRGDARIPPIASARKDRLSHHRHLSPATPPCVVAMLLSKAQLIGGRCPTLRLPDNLQGDPQQAEELAATKSASGTSGCSSIGGRKNLAEGRQPRHRHQGRCDIQERAHGTDVMGHLRHHARLRRRSIIELTDGEGNLTGSKIAVQIKGKKSAKTSKDGGWSATTGKRKI